MTLVIALGRIPETLAKERYDQFRIERDVMSFWEKNDIYEKVQKKSFSSRRKVYFLDGPPYASSNIIHPGTAWNKVIKDVLLRYYRMMGFWVWDRPGFDTHGLPIEISIEKEFNINTKKDISEKIGIDKFVNSCRNFAYENIKAMINQFREIGVFMNWEDPYITFRNEYVESGWWLLKKAFEKGLLSEELLVVHWCPRCQTTLADYEVSEYKEMEDPSIYVKFPVAKRENEYLLVWTTTPWTLPANIFVMAHPDMDYVKVKVGNNTLILAKKRLEAVMKDVGIDEYEILEEFKGSELEGLEYRHPLDDLVTVQRDLSKYHKVVMAPEAVTPYEGTGLVHSAPGHGDIDFEINKRKVGAPVISLVGNDGRMVEGAGRYEGLYFRTEANKAIINDLKKKGYLFYEGRVVHRYPVCWRCKTPLVLRATRQWIIRVSKIRKELLKEAESIEWKPAWAKTRFLNLIKNVRDWVISRQRFWGIPLPIWVCTKCGHKVVIGSVNELKKYGGKIPKDLHRPWIDEVKLKCPKCGGVMKRIPDVFDVWFDSGISFYASLGYPKNEELWKRLNPVDFIVEGHDQIRGWFFSLLRSGVIGFGRTPYKKVLVHGFMLDEKGREMHKSLGNYVDFNELISKVPRDVVRLWLLQNTVWEDLRFSWRELDEMRRDFTIMWNIFSFVSMYMGIDKFDPTKVTIEDLKEHLKIEDLWMLSKVNSFLTEYHKTMNSLEVHEAARLIRRFIVEDVSRWYLRLIRRRVWVEEDTLDKKAAYVTLYYVIRRWLLAAAPFIPFFTEYIYQKIFKECEESEESIHLEKIPESEPRFVNKKLERLMDIAKDIVETINSIRMEAGIKIRRPLKRAMIIPKDDVVKEVIAKLLDIIKSQTNVKDIVIERTETLRRLKIYKVEPVLKEIGPTFKRDSPLVLEVIKKRQSEIAKEIISKGSYSIEVEGKRLRIEKRHVKILAEYPDWLKVKESKQGLIGLDIRVSRMEELEGLARDLVRRVQFMRKEANLDINDYVDLWIVTRDKDLLEAIDQFEEYIKYETRAKNLFLKSPSKKAFIKEWMIEDKKIALAIRRSS